MLTIKKSNWFEIFVPAEILIIEILIQSFVSHAMWYGYQTVSDMCKYQTGGRPVIVTRSTLWQFVRYIGVNII